MKNENVIPPQNGSPACDTTGFEPDLSQNPFVRAQTVEIIGQLAIGAAHDFKNILSAMLFQLEEVRRTLPKNQKSEMALSELDAGVQRGIELTSQMLLLGINQAPELVILELSAVFDNLVRMLRRLIGSNISLTLSGASQGIWLRADLCSLERVLMNLVINARDAMPDGGHVHIETQLVDIAKPIHDQCAEARPGQFARISVTDTGCGMCTDTMNHAFEPFFTTKQPGKGSGLGLATIRHIVRQHEGWLEVKSAPGKGSTFALYFPTCNPPGNPSSAKTEMDILPCRTTPAAPEALPPACCVDKLLHTEGQ